MEKTRAHEQAIDEDSGRELGTGINPRNINFEGLFGKTNFISTFDKFDFIRQHADELVEEETLPFVTKTDTSTILLATKTEYIRAWDYSLSKRNRDQSYDKSTSYGIRLTNTEDDRIAIEVYKYKEWLNDYERLNRYKPVSRTVVNKDDTASIERYDAESGTIGEAVELGKSELDNMFTHLVQGKIIPDIQEAA